MKKSCANMTSRVWAKVLFTALAAVTTLALCGACAKKQSEIKLSAAEDTGEFGVYYAKLFSIEYLPDGVKLVTDYSGRRCLLVPRDVEAPDDFTSSTIEHDLLVFTPVKKALYTSTTQVSFLDVLEENDDAEYDVLEENSLYNSVAAVTMPLDQWDLDSIEERMRDGKTAYIAQNSVGTIDIENVITLQPDIIFAEPAAMGMGDNLALFETAGLPYAVVCEWLEGENRASFEWIKFIAAFYNKDAEADAIFRQQLARLDELAELTADIPPDERPLVACGSVYNGVVYAQGGDSVTAGEYWKAGGRYFLGEGTGGGTLRITPEEFFDKARDADILMYNSMIQYTPDKKALLDESPLFAEFKSFKNDRIYVLARSYYMNGARIALKFEDTVAIFQPELFSPGRRMTFYEKLPD